MTQVELGRALGVSPQTVSQWETGYRRASSLAVRAIEMLRELGSREEELRERLQRNFNRLNALRTRLGGSMSFGITCIRI